MEQEIERLIVDTQSYRDYCRRNALHIDAAACSIRLVALREALNIVRKYNKS